MKIKRYPGKAVINDPSWMEIDGGNRGMDLLYAANWLDTQRCLSSSSSASNNSNSWDRASSSSTDNVDDKSLDEKTDNVIVEQDEEDMIKKHIKSPKYHSDKYLAKIAKKKLDLSIQLQDDLADNSYYLPSQTKLIRQRSFRTDQSNLTRENSIKTNSTTAAARRTHSSKEDTASVKYKNVINDLEIQMINNKKSVRFHDNSVEIKDAVSDSNQEKVVDNENKFRVRLFQNPLNQDFEQFHTTTVHVTSDEVVTTALTKNNNTSLTTVNQIDKSLEETATPFDRLNEWIHDQNKYISSPSEATITVTTGNRLNYDVSNSHPTFPTHSEGRVDVTIPLNVQFTTRVKNQHQTDEEFYEQLINARQRIPAAKTGFVGNSPIVPIDFDHPYENEEIIKQETAIVTQPKLSSYKPVQVRTESQKSDFLIPRPKLIVPVHTYAIRKRRTGNLHTRISESSRGDPTETLDSPDALSSSKEVCNKQLQGKFKSGILLYTKRNLIIS